jgi:hypothetical protein
MDPSLPAASGGLPIAHRTQSTLAMSPSHSVSKDWKEEEEDLFIESLLRGGCLSRYF